MLQFLSFSICPEGFWKQNRENYESTQLLWTFAVFHEIRFNLSRWRDIFYICFFLNVHTIDLIIVFFVKLLLNRYWVSRSLLLFMRRKFSKSRTSGFICLALNREHSRNEEIKLQKWYITQRVIHFQDVVRYLTLHVSK